MCTCIILSTDLAQSAHRYCLANSLLIAYQVFVRLRKTPLQSNFFFSHGPVEHILRKERDGYIRLSFLQGQ